MKKLSIEAQDNTPSVVLDKENSLLEIRGYSFPDDAYAFYAQIIDWFKEYVKDPNTNTKVDFKYVNSTSSKYINDILKKLDGINEAGKNTTVDWLFDTDDEDIQQLGITLKEFHKLPINVLAKGAAKGPEKRKMF
jgi:uncharacterized protein YxeA